MKEIKPVFANIADHHFLYINGDDNVYSLNYVKRSGQDYYTQYFKTLLFKVGDVYKTFVDTFTVDGCVEVVFTVTQINGCNVLTSSPNIEEHIYKNYGIAIVGMREKN